MNIVVVGCGRLGSELAYRLYKQGHQVTVIDQNPGAFENLHSDFRGRTVEGEVMSQDVLRWVGMDKADGVAAVTNSDAVNAVVAQVARSVYNVPNVVVRNYNPRWRPILDAFKLNVVSSSIWGAQRLEEMLYHPEMRTVYSAGNGEVEVYEFDAPAAVQGRRLTDFLPSEGCVVVALTRAGHAIIPGNETTLLPGDLVQVSATLEGINTLRQRLRPTKED